MIGERRLSLLEQLLRLADNDRVIFGMHLDQQSGASRSFHQPQPGPIVCVKNRVPVGRVDLGAGDPGVDEGIELALPPLGEAGDVEVDAVVDVGATVDQLEPRRQRLRERLAGQLRREVEVGRHAAGRRRKRAALEVVRRSCRAGVEQQMGMRVDDAGQDQQAGGIDDVGASVDTGSDLSDLAVHNQHVGILLAPGGHHPPAAD